MIKMAYAHKGTKTRRAPVNRTQKASSKFTRVSSVAELLLVSDRTVRRWIDDKKLRKHQFGGATRIPAVDLIGFIQRARRGGPLTARNPLEDTFHSVENAADILNVCVRTVRRRIGSGVLVVHDFGGIIRIAGNDLHDFIERSRRE
jgi:excisionase family DNA binding protein